MNKLLMMTCMVVAACGVSSADDLIVSEAGTMMLASPVTYEKIKNQVGSGAVTFDQSAVAVDEAHKNSFTGLEGVTGSQTLFCGGYWDFGLGRFFTEESTQCDCAITLSDGAVVTNVGTALMGGRTGGQRNAINVRSDASVWMDRLVLGQRQASWQNNTCLVSSGGSLTLRQLDLSDSYRDNNKLYYSGNKVIVSNSTSRLTVTGDAYLSRPVDSNSADGTVGGNTLVVTDGAFASVSNLYINCAATHGVSNRVVVSKNAVLVTERCQMGNSWSVGPNCGQLDRFEVLDGAAYTNKGSFAFGYIGNDSARSGSRAETLVVSNATFVTKNFSRPKDKNGTEYVAPVFSSAGSTIVLSGADTVFQITENTSSSGYTDRPLFGWDGCTLIVENNMQLQLWNYGYSFNKSANNNAIVVRSGARLTSKAGYSLTTGSWQRGAPCRGNRLLVEDGGTVSLQYVWISQRDSLLLVSNATVAASAYRQDSTNGTISIGGALQNNINQFGPGSNCVLRVAGDHPVVSAPNGSIIVLNHSRVAFDLPTGGYVNDAAPVSTGDGFYMDATSSIDVFGIRGVRKARFGTPSSPSIVRYRLVKAKKWSVPDAVIEESNARLPKGVTLLHVTEGGMHYLVCDIVPNGFILSFR